MATTAPSTALTGKTLSFKIGATEYMQDVLKWELKPDKQDKSDLTFAEVAGGSTASWTLNVTALASTAAASFWSFCWDNAGKTVAVTLAPWGNTTPSADQPTFTGQCTITLPPSLSDEANSGKRATFDIDLDVDSITKKTSAA
ncbi:hypothetical protein [Acidipropionibacterium timonense]|uniref:hypothetical protein n=1 Tax=Acidipropionibacterium timonense TaxID=2161818 RepID=UPI001030C4A4|nr:hypothetical protein [Acidipropionibacterium timonense]